MKTEHSATLSASAELRKQHSLSDAQAAPPWPVDVVMMWCGLPETPQCRYSEDLRFSLRSVCANMPWVRRIMLVVQDDFERPVWMKPSGTVGGGASNSSRLVLLKASKFIPPRYLPNYNWHVLQSWLWRVRSLSKHFVFLHDDMYIGRPTPWQCFFTKEGAPINRHYAGGADHGIYPHHRIPYVRMWVNAIQKHGIHNTRVQQQALPYRKDQLKKLFHTYNDLVEAASRQRYVSGARDFDLLRFCTAITSTEGGAVLVRTDPYEWYERVRTRGVVDHFTEGDDVAGVQNVLESKPRFICVNNSGPAYTHLYDMLRVLFPKLSAFERTLI